MEFHGKRHQLRNSNQLNLSELAHVYHAHKISNYIADNQTKKHGKLFIEGFGENIVGNAAYQSNRTYNNIGSITEVGITEATAEGVSAYRQQRETDGGNNGSSNNRRNQTTPIFCAQA